MGIVIIDTNGDDCGENVNNDFEIINPDDNSETVEPGISHDNFEIKQPCLQEQETGSFENDKIPPEVFLDINQINKILEETW